MQRLSMVLHGTTHSIHHCRFVWLMVRRKKERTTALVVSAVLAGFRAIDTGQL